MCHYNKSVMLIRIASYKLLNVSLLFYELAKCPDDILISYLYMRPESGHT